jgi:hypothetical protein
MRRAFTAAALLSAVSLTTIAIAQTKPVDPMPVQEETAPLVAPATGSPTVIPDARSLASDQQVGESRRAYRAACNRHENAGFCDCVTAGVAQVLMPDEVRMAARTFGERIPAQGDAYQNDQSPAMSSAARIAQVEAQYANACAQFR